MSGAGKAGAAGAAAAGGRGGAGKGRTNEEIFAGFQALRGEQRQLAAKLSELEMDLNEHKIVLDTLNQVSEDRKCFRMIGGVLCERTVKEVIPELVTNRDQLPKIIASLSEQLTKKGAEINEYIETHNIRIQKTDDLIQQQEDKEISSNTKSNVLVSNN